jgi:hypothetical protein
MEMANGRGGIDMVRREVQKNASLAGGASASRMRVSELPKLTLYMKPEQRAQLEAASVIRGQPAWRLMGDAWQCFTDTFPPEQEKKIKTLAQDILKRPARGP